MSTWLARALALDASLVESRDRRTARDDEDLSYLWNYLIPHGDRPAAATLLRLIEACVRRGLGWDRSTGGYVVYPADIGDREIRFGDDTEAAVHWADSGGGILLKRDGETIALVHDPRGVIRRQVIDRAHLADRIAFAEFSVWMPVLDDEGPDEAVERLASEVADDVERILHPTYGYSMGRQDLPQISKRWCVHSEVVGHVTPSEIFWYQYFSSSYAAQIAVRDFRNVGFQLVDRANGGIAAMMDESPSASAEMLETARVLWPHRLVAKTVD